jgi:transposase-like protein
MRPGSPNAPGSGGTCTGDRPAWQVVNVLLTARRNTLAARRFFTRALTALKVVTHAAAVYPSVLADLVPAA